MGRTPDYMNVTFAGFAGGAHEWAAHGNEAGAEQLVAYQKHLRRADLSLTHTIVQPNVDKMRGRRAEAGRSGAAAQGLATRRHGILVRGARVLATLAPFADEIAVYPRTPLPEGAEPYALCFCIPMSTPGLKFICRDSMSAGANRFDHPLSSRFDEQDAFVIFDDVEVPRDRVFIDGNLAVYNTVMNTTWMPNIMHQTMIRAQTKLEFAWGLACSMAETINASDPGTQQMLGEIWCLAEFARSAIIAAEQGARDYGNGFWAPDVRPLYALRSMLPSWFPRVNEIIRLIGSHYLLTAPRTAEFADPALRRADRHLSARRRLGQRRTARTDLPAGVGFRRQRARQPQRAVRALLPRLRRAQSAARLHDRAARSAPTAWSTASSTRISEPARPGRTTCRRSDAPALGGETRLDAFGPEEGIAAGQVVPCDKRVPLEADEGAQAEQEQREHPADFVGGCAAAGHERHQQSERPQHEDDGTPEREAAEEQGNAQKPAGGEEKRPAPADAGELGLTGHRMLQQDVHDITPFGAHGTGHRPDDRRIFLTSSEAGAAPSKHVVAPRCRCLA